MWFYRLFAFADGADAALMALGVLGVAANGAALPLMTVVFGRLVGTATRDVVSRNFAVSLQFIYLTVAAAIPSNMITKTFLYFYTTL
jgi:ATP-binding cassette, subfamily B (MDR/TAP), member 1